MACYSYQIVVDSNDLAAAVGNTNPAFNNTLFFNYTDCDGNPQTNSYSSPGTYLTLQCIDDTLLTSLYYYSSDLQTIPTFSTSNPDTPCSVGTPTPTPTITSTPTTTPVVPFNCGLTSGELPWTSYFNANPVGTVVNNTGVTIYVWLGAAVPAGAGDTFSTNSPYSSLTVSAAGGGGYAFSSSYVTLSVAQAWPYNITRTSGSDTSFDVNLYWSTSPSGTKYPFSCVVPTPTPTITPTITPSPTETTTVQCGSCSGSGWEPYDSQNCYRINVTGATAPVTPISLGPHDVNVYSSFGSRFYETGFPTSGIGTVESELATPTAGGSYTNPTWSNPSSLTTAGPLNRCAIWTNPFTSTPTNTWIGFSDCLSGITATKTYYVGIGADNEFRLVLDGVEILNTVGNAWTDQQFKWWHVYPVEIGAGNHTIELYGLNLGSDAGFGCEIYDNTLEDLTGFTSYSQINVVYTSSGTTEATIVQNLSGTYLSSGYTCPSGYVYSTCSGSCIQYEYCDITITQTPTPTPTETPTPTQTQTQTPSTTTTPTETPTPTQTQLDMLYSLLIVQIVQICVDFLT